MKRDSRGSIRPRISPRMNSRTRIDGCDDRIIGGGNGGSRATNKTTARKREREEGEGPEGLKSQAGLEIETRRPFRRESGGGRETRDAPNAKTDRDGFGVRSLRTLTIMHASVSATCIRDVTRLPSNADQVESAAWRATKRCPGSVNGRS